ncbi:hypothetical protein TNCV_1127391 [Trichonephila clavipes]|nr:hypothetical protein TNCV_1127391 [Trichonephila clavipes]
MPRKRKSNLSQSSNKARGMKEARLNETFPQAKLRRLEQVERETSTRAVPSSRSTDAEYLASQWAVETPEHFQALCQQNAEYMASQQASEAPEQSQARRLQQATFMSSQRDTETVEAAESRRRAVAERAQQ